MLPYGTTRKKEREFSIYNTIIQNICPGHTQVMNNSLLRLLKKDIDVNNIYVYDSWITNIAMLYGKISFNNESYTLYRQHSKNQLGYGRGMIGQLLASVKRAGSGDGKKYRNQIKYFVKMNEFELRNKGYYDELNRYICSEKLIQRIMYGFIGKLHRQKRIESLAFYIANIVGKY
jgi:rhamnosyltransferase